MQKLKKSWKNYLSRSLTAVHCTGIVIVRLYIVSLGCGVATEWCTLWIMLSCPLTTGHCPHGWAHVSSVSRQCLHAATEEESQIMQTSGHLHSRAVLLWSAGASLGPGAGPSASCRYVLCQEHRGLSNSEHPRMLMNLYYGNISRYLLTVPHNINWHNKM